MVLGASMITPTELADQFRMVVADWDGSQPSSKDGVGTRSEIWLVLELLKDGYRIHHPQIRYFQRETPALPWRPSAVTDVPEGSPNMAMVRAALYLELWSWIAHAEVV